MSDLDLVRGTLDVLILKTLTAGALHGYDVARSIKRTSDEALLVEEGALYPALHRLERRGWVRSSWGVSRKNRRAKFYELTPAGRRALRAQLADWGRYVEAVAKVLEREPRRA